MSEEYQTYTGPTYPLQRDTPDAGPSPEQWSEKSLRLKFSDPDVALIYEIQAVLERRRAAWQREQRTRSCPAIVPEMRDGETHARFGYEFDGDRS